MRLMIRRGPERLWYEIQTGSGPTPYALVVATPDGTRVINEAFAEPYALHERISQIERLMTRFGWHCPQLAH